MISMRFYFVSHLVVAVVVVVVVVPVLMCCPNNVVCLLSHLIIMLNIVCYYWLTSRGTPSKTKGLHNQLVINQGFAVSVDR